MVAPEVGGLPPSARTLRWCAPPRRLRRAVTASRMTSDAPGNSGARVRRRSDPSLDSSHRVKLAVDGGRRWRRSWAPARSGWRNGPSMWTPSTCAPVEGACSRPWLPAARARRAVTSSEHEMQRGEEAGTPDTGAGLQPWCRWQSGVGSSVNRTPAAPLTWRSTKPGAMTPPRTSMRWRSSGCRGRDVAARARQRRCGRRARALRRRGRRCWGCRRRRRGAGGAREVVRAERGLR